LLRCQHLQAFAYVGTGNALGAWQVNHFAQGGQVIKFALPVMPHAKYGNLMAGNIFSLLLPAVFGNGQIDTAQAADDFQSVGKGHHGFLPFRALNSSVETPTTKRSPKARNRSSKRK